jgi:hypothetical protein
MTAEATEERSLVPDRQVVYVVITPTGELLQQCADGRLDPTASPDDPYQSKLWMAVGATAAVPAAPLLVYGIAIPGQDMRAKMVDSGEAEATHPGLYQPNPFATAVLFELGLKLPRIARGAVAILHEEDPDTGFTNSLSPVQLKAINAAHAMVLSTENDSDRQRFA